MTVISKRPAQLLLHLAVGFPFAVIGATAIARACRAVGALLGADPITRAALLAALLPSWPSAGQLPAALLAILVWLMGIALIIVSIGMLGFCLRCAWQLLLLGPAWLFGARERLAIAERSSAAHFTARPRVRVDTLHFSLALPRGGGQHTLAVELPDPHLPARRAYDHAEHLWVRRLHVPPVVAVDWARSGAVGEPSAAAPPP